MQTSVIVLLYNKREGSIQKESHVMDMENKVASEREAQDYAYTLARRYNPDEYTVAICVPTMILQAEPPARPPAVVRKVVTPAGELLPHDTI